MDTTNKFSATNPAHNKRVPSRLEAMIDRIVNEETAPEKDLIVGGPMPRPDAIARQMFSRQQVIYEAQKDAGGLSDRVALFINTIFNNGVSLPTLKRISAAESDPSTAEDVLDVYMNAGMMGSPTKDDTLAIVAAARSILRHVMTGHAEEYHPTDFKTPFQAWRVREYLTEQIVQCHEGIVRNARWSDLSIDEVQDDVNLLIANFSCAELVLWNQDIWKAAIRGSDTGVQGTVLEPELIDSIIPQFWQFDTPMRLTPDERTEEHLQPTHWAENVFELGDGEFELIGFIVMPKVTNVVDVKFPEEAVSKVEPVGDQYRITINDTSYGSPFHQALQAGTKFKQRGVQISLLFMPFGQPHAIPRLRFLAPLYEKEVIRGALRSEVVAALHFLNLKYVQKQDAPIAKKELKADRPLFKKVRHGKVEVPPIKIIHLRKPERRERTSHDDVEAKKMNYTCHWLVDAHWRKQWYPGVQRHRAIRILSYVKGDLDKPFKPPREKVYKAVR